VTALYCSAAPFFSAAHVSVRPVTAASAASSATLPPPSAGFACHSSALSIRHRRLPRRRFCRSRTWRCCTLPESALPSAPAGDYNLAGPGRPRLSRASTVSPPARHPASLDDRHPGPSRTVAAVMAAFQAVNTTTLTVPGPSSERPGDETTPTTPRPTTNFFPEPQPSDDPRAEDPSARTPTRNSFAGLGAQRPLPSSTFTPSRDDPDSASREGAGALNRENSHRSTQSVDSQDIEMHRDDDGQDGSDNESVTSDGTRPSKKKKGQRFFCKDFPPCHLSFTRSEHLARHIRYVYGP
jgi:hypothetical protein